MNTLVDHAKEFKELNVKSIFTLLHELIEMAEKSVLNGIRRKKYVLDALSNVISAQPDGENKDSLVALLNNVIPHTIDLSISLSKTIHVSASVSKCFLCF